MPAFVEYSVNDKIYIDLKQLLPLRPYAVGCKSIAQLIGKKQYQSIINGQIIDGTLVVKEKRSYKHGSIFVDKAEIAELFDAHTTEIVEYPSAPPLLEDTDLVFFKDDDGDEHHVLMRGTRTREGIYFKVKDVERVFEMKRLDDILAKDHTRYEAGVDYQWFALTDENKVRIGQSRELYPTYNGLMRVISVSQSGIGFKFKEWINELVFAAAFGTIEQKVKAFERSFNIDADHLKAIMSNTDGEISCLYLIDIKQTKDERRVFKYGYTKHLRSRFREHMRKYGDTIELVKFSFVPEMNLSKAEKMIKEITLLFAFETDGEKELLALDDHELASVLLVYKSVATNYCGQLKEIVQKYESDALGVQLDVSEMKRAYDAKLHEATTRAIIANKDNEILQMKIQMLEAQLAAARM
jgi:hypothetical protein